MLRSLIRQGAAEGSFDRALAADTPGAVEFFARLKRALVSGYFVEEDPTTGRVESVPVTAATRKRNSAGSNGSVSFERRV